MQLIITREKLGHQPPWLMSTLRPFCRRYWAHNRRYLTSVRCQEWPFDLRKRLFTTSRVCGSMDIGPRGLSQVMPFIAASEALKKTVPIGDINLMIRGERESTFNSATDLAELRKSDKSEYQRLAQKLRKALDDRDSGASAQPFYPIGVSGRNRVRTFDGARESMPTPSRRNAPRTRTCRAF